MMVDRRWPTCISFAMLGDEKSTTTLGAVSKESKRIKGSSHYHIGVFNVVLLWAHGEQGGAGRAAQAPRTTLAQHVVPWGALSLTPRGHTRYMQPTPRRPSPWSHPPYSAVAASAASHLPNKPLWGEFQGYVPSSPFQLHGNRTLVCLLLYLFPFAKSRWLNSINQ